MEFIKNNKQAILIFSALGALSGIVAVAAYLDNRKDKKLTDQIHHYDRQIKELDLAYKKKRNQQEGLL